MNNTRDDDDDNNGRRSSVWLVLPCCCFGIAALIWLIVLTVQLHNLDERLDVLIKNCAGVCPASGGAVAGSASIRGVASHHGAVKAAHIGAAATAVAPVKKHASKAAKLLTEEVPIDAAPRWSRVGDAAKKPSPPKAERVQ